MTSFKGRFLNEGFDKHGRSTIAMWSNTMTLYRRKNGTVFVMCRGKRLTLTERADGTFYVATHQPSNPA